MTVMTPRALCSLYSTAHNHMRNTDGMQPGEAFDELLKYLSCRQSVSEDSSLSTEQIRGVLANLATSTEHSWIADLWQPAEFRLSDNALQKVHATLGPVRFSEITADIRSAALSQFLTPELRKGLGIFLTPENVVRMIVEAVKPQPGARVLDPACGSGTFLTAVVEHWRQSGAPCAQGVYGVDKSARMIQLAELNLGHTPGVSFNAHYEDALNTSGESAFPESTFDYIFTNPPFGVTVDEDDLDLSGYTTCPASAGRVRKCPSEVLFIERCLRLLRPGGTLAIVLPRSVISNQRLKTSREAIDSLGLLTGVCLLPPETFAVAGTQTTTAVLFLQRRGAEDTQNTQSTVAVADVRNVGYDTTGRSRAGTQLPDAAKFLSTHGSSKNSHGWSVVELPAREPLTQLRGRLSNRPKAADSLRLGDLAECICTGRTPSRASYSDEGMFVVKVGNLTGGGIDWSPRARNHIAVSGRMKPPMLQTNDILMTSSAHSLVYIAKKIDMVGERPDWIGDEVTFVGELLLVRPNPDLVDPFLLLAFLRLPSTGEALRSMASGQTAHLLPQDVAELGVPATAISSDGPLKEVAELLRQELELSRQVNELAHRQATLFATIADVQR